MWTLLLVLLAPPSLGMRDWGGREAAIQDVKTSDSLRVGARGAAITRLTAHLRGTSDEMTLTDSSLLDARLPGQSVV